jgi:hypothetical protein
MTDTQLTTLWLGAFRYYIGRRSYAVSDFCDLLIAEWNIIPESCKNIIQKELEDAFERDRRKKLSGINFTSIMALGDNCDRAEWQRVKEFIND